DEGARACSYCATRTELAPANDNLAYAGLSVVRLERWWSPCDERCPAYDGSAPVVLGAATNDRRNLEECDCRSIVCDSSTPCRIRRMGEREKRRAKRSVFFANARGIRSLHLRSVDNSLPGSHSPIRGRPHVKANAGDSPIHPSPCGLLATSAFWRTTVSGRRQKFKSW